MPEVVEANCPHCQNLVRIPVEWIHQPMRCKHCRQIFQAKQQPEVSDSPPKQPARSLRTPVPPQVLRSRPVSPGNVQLPAPSPLSSLRSAVSAPVPQSHAQQRTGGGWWVGAVLAGAGLLTAIVLVVVFWDRISDLADGTAPRTDENRVAKLIDPKKHFDESPARKAVGTVHATMPETRAVPFPRPRRIPPPKTEGQESVKVPPQPPLPDRETVKVQPPKKDPPEKVQVARDNPPKKPMRPTADGLFPRRALAISVSNYLLANPLNYGGPREKGFPGSSVRAALNDFGNFVMKFPNTQLFELSDAAPRDPHPPVKSVIETAITDFLNGSRAQDRVVVLFAGHAIEIEKEAYLVPLDGMIRDADPKDLVSLAWLYDRLKECKARQKLLILDVCRFDPARGEQRPGSGPMGEVLDARLQQPPPGVQVWSSCVKGQQAYEFERGSVFLQALCAAMQEPLPSPADPNEPLPLEQLLPRVNRTMQNLLQMHKLTQTSRLAGTESPGGAPYDPGAALAMVIKIRPPTRSFGETANPEALRTIVDELRLVPPVRSVNDAEADITLESLPPFPAKALEPYQADYMSQQAIEANPGRYPLRTAVLKAAQVLRENVHKFRMKEVFNGRTTAQVKQQVAREQVDPGKSILALKEALEELKKAGENRKQEKSKRWQANYDYVLARLESRLVYVYEYSYMLAQIRGDSLPPLENGATGYRLGAKKKVSIPEPEVRDWVKEIDRTWQRVAREHANTPWAVVANRERMTVLGLEWRPTRQ